MPDLAEIPPSPFDPAVDHEAAADAGADGHREHHPVSDASAQGGLGEAGEVGVVVDRDRNPEPLVQGGTDRDVGAGAMRHPPQDARGGIDQARHSHPDGAGLARVADQPGDHGGKIGDVARSAGFGGRGGRFRPVTAGHPHPGAPAIGRDHRHRARVSVWSP